MWAGLCAKSSKQLMWAPLTLAAMQSTDAGRARGDDLHLYLAILCTDRHRLYGMERATIGVQFKY